jgi:hypothetical protein
MDKWIGGTKPALQKKKKNPDSWIALPLASYVSGNLLELSSLQFLIYKMGILVNTQLIRFYEN